MAVPTVTDYGGDGTIDVIYTNDFGQQHTPTAVIGPNGVDRSLPRLGGMGVAAGDVDGDMISDYIFTNVRDDVLWLSKGGWHRGDLPPGGAYASHGVRVKWGASMFDADNDGDLELYCTAGRLDDDFFHPNPYEHPNVLYSDGKEIAVEAGLATESYDRTAAIADYDQDGRLDLLVGSTTDWRLFRNVSEAGHYLQVDIDDHPGTVAVVTCDGKQFHNEYTGSRSGAQDESLLHIGVGSCAGPATLEVRWPWGGRTVKTDLAVDQRISLDRPILVTVEPPEVTVGETFTVTYHGKAEAVRWGETNLTNFGSTWSLTQIAETAGDTRVELTVDNEPLSFRPWVRVTGPEHWDIHFDPMPLRRGITHHVTVRTSAEHSYLNLSTPNGDIQHIRSEPGRWTGEVKVSVNSPMAVFTLKNGDQQIGETRMVSTVAPVSTLNTEVRVQRIEREAGPMAQVLVMPMDATNTYIDLRSNLGVTKSNRISMTVDGESTNKFELMGSTRWGTEAPWGGLIEIQVDGVKLPPIDPTELDKKRTADPERSLLFADFERARSDGEDLILLFYRPLDANGQPVHLDYEPQVVAPKLTWLGSTDPKCQATPESEECIPDGPSGRWTNFATEDFWYTILRSGRSEGPITITVDEVFSTKIHLYDTARAAPTERTTAGFAEGWLYIEPRDANGAVIGSGVDINVETLPPSVAPIVYLGHGRYARPGGFDGAIIQVGDITMRLGTAYVAPTDDTGCSTHGAHNTSPYTALLIFIAALMLLLLGQRVTPHSAHIRSNTKET
jgi:hypothetical protein